MLGHTTPFRQEVLIVCHLSIFLAKYSVMDDCIDIHLGKIGQGANVVYFKKLLRSSTAKI